MEDVLCSCALPPWRPGKRRFRDLSEQEVLALAISSEEEDGRIYAAYAAKLRAQYPASAAVFDGMAMEEDEHRRRLIGVYKRRFGDLIVPLRREHIADFYTRRPVWLVENLVSIVSVTKPPTWNAKPGSSTRPQPDVRRT